MKNAGGIGRQAGSQGRYQLSVPYLDFDFNSH